MLIKGQLLFLGTGGSMGIPVVACTCLVCTSTSAHNKRLRASALCTIGKQKLLIDCGPDFRQQALKYNIDQLDGVIFTHAHNDHTVGVDDLKTFCQKTGRPMPCLLSPETAKELQARFSYLFEEKEPYAGLMTRFAMQMLEHSRGDVVFQGVRIHYFSYEQLHMRVNGYRIGDLAYVTDIRVFPPTIFKDLAGVKTLILSALRMESSRMHFSLDEAVEFAKQVGAEKTWLMHIAHELDHKTGNAHLPENIRLAYDGLELEFHADIVDDF